jgi:glycosyltransferase involved in cell wall biosynthesis
LKIAVILPHTLLFGGVKRYLELGNRLISRGHDYRIYTPEGIPPDWFSFSGPVEQLSNLAQWSGDVVMTSEEVYLPDLRAAQSRLRVFYVISRCRALPRIAKLKDIVFWANSTTAAAWVKRKTGISPAGVFGGVDTAVFSPASCPEVARPFTIVSYGRLNGLKGTELVVKACEKLYKKGRTIHLILFDTPVASSDRERIDAFATTVPHEFVLGHPVDRQNEIYNRGDCFVSAERKGGWANTAAEAMACGIPVAATGVGTRDFLTHKKTGIVVRRRVGSIARAIIRMMDSPGERRRFALAGRKQILLFDWERTTGQMLRVIQDALNP